MCLFVSFCYEEACTAFLEEACTAFLVHEAFEVTIPDQMRLTMTHMTHQTRPYDQMDLGRPYYTICDQMDLKSLYLTVCDLTRCDSL